MVERRGSARDAASLAQRAYTLQPARLFAARVMLWIGIGVFGIAVGATAMHWHSLQNGAAAAPCVAAPVSEDSAQADLARTRLALEQEVVARAAVQKTADSAAADVAKLTVELQFLRGQTKANAQARR